MKARPALLLLLLLVGVTIGRGDDHDHDHDDHDHDHDDHDHDHDHHHDDHDHDHDHDDHDHDRDHDHDDHDHDDHDDHSDEFEEIDHRLDKVTARIENIHDVIRRRVDPARISKARSTRARVQKIEGTGCDRHFQCGGSDPECQSYLFVCDGRKDCRNGADEAFCELPTKKGDYFEGHMIWDTCTLRKPDVIGFEVMNVKSSDFFTPVVKLHANILLEYENELYDGHDSLPAVGYYHFGRHIVALLPPEEDRLGLYCVFDGFNQDRCDGFIAHEASMDVCAEFIFVRQ